MAESVEERRVWDLLARNFYWQVPSDFFVKVWGRSESSLGPVRLQVFEIAVATIFANLRPEYEWYVTPDLPDGGLDFVGQGRFLHDEVLGIAAAITVGGQCKKRSRVTDIVAEVSGSLARMSITINPTFFVVAFSARLTQRRISNARRILEETHRRHCHILDRGQLEGLICDHLVVVDPILRQSLSSAEIHDVVEYFESRGTKPTGGTVDVQTPTRVLAGVPFRIALSFRSPLVALRGTRLWWKPSGDGVRGPANTAVTLIGPVGADSDAGVECFPTATVDDPLTAHFSIEFMSYAVGQVDLGEITIGRRIDVIADRPKRVKLGETQVVENVRPRFFERPFQSALTQLSLEYDRSLARGVAFVAVVGSGGSGKSRLCEEFALEKQRRGCNVVQAKQSKTLDDPHRLLADLLIGLADVSVSISDPADCVIGAISQYDRSLAERAAPAIRSITGRQDGTPALAADQALLSSFLLLIVVRTRHAPLIVHLQDLHWCAADTLLLLERLTWQLEMVSKSDGTSVNDSARGVFFLLEGRVWESDRVGSTSWSTRLFEVFLEKLGCPTLSCLPFDQTDSLEFVRRLFEDRHSAQRLVDSSLLELQAELAERINHTAGGNPFHTLEQIRILKERHVLAQNPETGLMYMIQPAGNQALLPETVFDSIRLRLQYLKSAKPELATLLWAASLLEDRIPVRLFRYLWRAIGPDLSLAEIDATEFLWTGGVEPAEVSFRHENYFQSLRRLEVPVADQKRLVDIYAAWFEQLPTLDAAGKFRWARILVQSPTPDAQKVRLLLRTALVGARRHGDLSLARRVQTMLLDFNWTENAQSPVRMNSFLHCCDDELSLCRELLSSDRLQAASRILYLRDLLRERLSLQPGGTSRSWDGLRYRLLAADVVRSQILFNDRQPALASEVAAGVIRDIRAVGNAQSAEQNLEWQILEMEALHSYAVALALGGEIPQAINASEQAVRIALVAQTPHSLDVMSTHANILLATDLEAPESILRECMGRASSEPTSRETQDAITINLGMTLILGAYRSQTSDVGQSLAKFSEASALLEPLFSNAFRVGRYPDAGAAALLLGIISALRNDGDEVSWFAQAVTAAARGAQMETLWRSHINLATGLHRRNARAIESVRDHARSALEILEETLSPYPHPDSSSRFELVRIPLAQAVRFLVQIGDERGLAALERYPALRSCFKDPEKGILRSDRGGYRSHEWLSVDEWDYVIY
jgi:hypothetical protein